MASDQDTRLGPTLPWEPPPRPARLALRGDRALVRPIEPAKDAEPLYRVSHPPLGDEAIWTYLFDGPYESADALREQMTRNQELDDPLFFTLARLPEEEPQGIASYLRITPEHGVIEIGNIWFGTPLQRTPAATEVIYLLVSHAFDDLGYRRVEWKCNARNLRSRRAAIRFGFRFEGIFRAHMVVKGHNRDTAWYAITDGEWPSVRQAFQTWLAPDNFDPDGRQRRALGELVAEARGT